MEVLGPCEHHIMEGREVTESCCGGEHTKTRRSPVHHFNAWEVVTGYLGAWVQRTFGHSLEQLAESDGEPTCVSALRPVE